MIVLSDNDDEYEIARNFCFDKEFDIVEELIAGDYAQGSFSPQV